MNEHERMRAELWSRVYAGIAGALAQTQDVATRWADKALKEFDERFPRPDGKAPRT
jgi:hypothetical protein